MTHNMHEKFFKYGTISHNKMSKQLNHDLSSLHHVVFMQQFIEMIYKFWSQERKLRQIWHKTSKRWKSLSLFGELNAKRNFNTQKTQSLYRLRGPKPTWKNIGKKTWLLWNFSGTSLKKRIIISNMWISHGFQPLCQGTKDLALDFKKTHS
jgi:hypothetical protein